MPAVIAASPWPAPSAARRDAGWQFARELASQRGWRFEMRRNVSTTPHQMLAAYGLLCALSLVVAAGFWWQGVAMVGLFAGVELAAIGVALWLVARHAGDRELITLSGRELAVEQHCGPGVSRTSFRTEWVRVEPLCDDGSLVELSGEGRSVRVGRHVRPELRVALAQELRRALRLLRTAGERVVDHELEA